MGILRDWMWGKGTTASDEALSGLVGEAQAIGVPEDVVLFLKYGRGEKALEVLAQVKSGEGCGKLIAKIEAAVALRNNR